METINIHYLGTPNKPDHTKNPNEMLTKIAEMERTFHLKERAYEAKIAQLQQENSELEHDFMELLAVLGEVMKDSPAVVIPETTSRIPRFREDRNLSGRKMLIYIG